MLRITYIRRFWFSSLQDVLLLIYYVSKCNFTFSQTEPKPCRTVSICKLICTDFRLSQRLIKVKLPLCSVKHHVMKTYGGVGGVDPPFLTSALDGGDCSATRLCRFTLGTHWMDWLGGPHNREWNLGSPPLYRLRYPGSLLVIIVNSALGLLHRVVSDVSEICRLNLLPKNRINTSKCIYNNSCHPFPFL
jgi:hypothetical protein